MTPIYCIFFIIGSVVGISNAEPPPKIVMENVNMKIEDNPFFGNWEVQLHPTGEQMSMKTPIKKDLPDNMRMKLEMTLDGDELPEVEMSICEAFDDDNIGKDLVEHGLPEGTFPKECPVKAGGNLEIKDYRFPNEKIPPGTQEGPIHGIMTIYEEGKAPIITMETNGQITH